MPIYEYECGACSARSEFIQKFNESPKRKCPECGKLKLKRLISAAAFHLKGTGWYETDFKGKKKPSDDSGAEASGSTAAAAKSGSDDSSKTDTKSDTNTDTKTDTKKDSSSKPGKSKSDSAAAA